MDEESRAKFERLLDYLIETHMDYFNKEPVTRHEAWFLGSSITNVLLLDEIRKLRKDLNTFFQKQGENNKITLNRRRV